MYLPMLAALSLALLLQTADAQHHRQQSFPASAVTSSRPLPTGTRVVRDIAYGSDPLQRYDAYLPSHAQPGAPILLMVHGGGWRRGDKAHPGVVDNKAGYWLQRGFVFISVNYRLLPDADPLTQAADVAAAVASVQQHASRWDADPRKLLLMGHSAGGHLVALLGSDPERLRQAGALRPLGVVALDSGALDVPALMAQPRLPQLYRDAFGDDPGDWRRASPQQQLHRTALPMLLVCSSTRDFPTSPCAEARKFMQRGNALSVPMQILPQALSHGEINARLGLPSAYTDAVDDWITARLTRVR